MKHYYKNDTEFKGHCTLAMEEGGRYYIFNVKTGKWVEADSLRRINDPGSADIVWWDEITEEDAIRLANELKQ